MEMDTELPSNRGTSNNYIGSSLDEIEVENSGDGVDLNLVNANKSMMNYFETQNGVEFETKEAAYSFYRDYARSVGFGITIKASRRSKKSGKFIDIKIACSRFGIKLQASNTVNQRPCFKTDCKASMHIKRRIDGKWYVHSFLKEHNHDICPHDVYYAKNRKNVKSVCQRNGMQLALHEGDLQLLLDYLMSKQAQTPNFYYALGFERESVKNVFWVYPQGRHDYVYFYDVVFFDTYYVKNKFKIPFVPIVGVNHHFQFLLLGCALIWDETPSTFAWLMRTWLRAVGGRSPKVVITDNEKSIKAATKGVFPDASHCFCLWHVYIEIRRNIGHKVGCFEDFMRKFDKCMYRSLSDEAFQKRWLKMVDKFELGDDEWIHSLYDDRGKWVPTYMRDLFLGGFSTVERSQSVCSFFDKYIDKETNCKEFINKLSVYLNESHEGEAKAEIQNQHTEPALKSQSPLEKQMSEVYTHAIFEKFQAEVLGIVACNVEKESEYATSVLFQVVDLEKQQKFTVLWNKAEYVVFCSCRTFQYIGFLCRHAMSVLQTCGVSCIKSDYILKRWTRNAKIEVSTLGSSNRHNSRVHRFNDLCTLAAKLGEQGSLSREAYDVACRAVEEALKQCVGVNNSVRSILDANKMTTKCSQDSGQKQDVNIFSKESKKRNWSRKRKGQGGVEALSDGIVYSQDELNSISSLQDSFYDNQPNMHGLLDNLNSLSPRVCHHASRHSPRGLGQLGLRAPSFQGCFDIQASLHDVENLTSKYLQDKHICR